MKVAPIPSNESERLAAVLRYGILDTPSDAVLDGIAQATADLCETPIALITLIDSNRQWFKSCIGIAARETPRDVTFCTHAILKPTELMEVEDALLDERFKHNPLVTGEPGIRFYAGKPLVTSDNFALGTLCVIDDKPRHLSDAQRDGINRLAQVVVNLLEERQDSRFAAIDLAVEQSVRHGVLICDPNQPGNPITFANSGFEKMTGYSSEEIVGRNCRFLQGADSNPETLTTLHNAIDARQPCTVVLENYRKDGTMFWNELSVSPVFDNTGAVTHFVGVQHDVTDQHLAKEHYVQLATATAEVDLAQASKNRLAYIIENSVNEIYVSCADTYVVLDANRAARENLGYSVEESKQLRPWDFVEGLSEDNLIQLIAPLLEGTLDAQVFETVHRRKDGTTYPVATQLQYMASQTPPVFSAIVQDISDRVQQEERIKLRDRAIEALDVGVSITDATKENTPLVYVNKALCDLTGYTADELLGQDVRMLQMDNQNQPEHLQLRAAQKRGEAIQVLLKSTRKDGTNYMDELAVSPVHNESGELTHYIGINRDVTEKLDIEARLRQAQKLDAIGQLTGGIAHDFNNLLSVIAGNLEFLALDITDNTQLECLNEADKAAQMGARLTQRLLSFAKQGTLTPEVLHVNDTILSSIQLLHSTIGETIELSSYLSPDLWPIYADQSQIENTVVNLVINARDAMPEGGKIKVESRNVTFEEEENYNDLGITVGDYIRLSVTDNGTGMTDEVQAHIFEPFFTTKGPDRGTGLGLASIHGFVTQSGGYLRVFSEVGHGTTIALYLPRHTDAVVNQVVNPQKKLTSSNTAARILVVEDNDMVRSMTVKRLRVIGHIIEQTANAHEAVEFLKRNSNIDLVFSDVVMAGMSGFDLAHWVQSNMPQCRVLLASGYSETPVESGSTLATEVTVLQKPYSLTELKSAISATLEDK